VEGDREQQGPPKKKRRRQALSCTECKRRKIKCDRNQPCGPCTRRNEQNKCQWHIVEPVEKYVTRNEYDDLKTRFDNLEAFVTRWVSAPPAAPVSMPMYQMGAHAPTTTTTEASTSYAASPQSAAVVYQQPLMSAVYQSHMDDDNHHHHNNNHGSRQRYAKSDELQEQQQSSSSRAYQPPPPTLLATAAAAAAADASSRSLSSPQAAALQTGLPFASQSPPMPMPRHRPADDKSPTTRTSPLSLASITSPFNHGTTSDPHHQQQQQHHHHQYQHHDQPKNYLAQTPTLGERLRFTSLVQRGPENLSQAVCRPLRAHPIYT
jgi:hypothetical protein